MAVKILPLLRELVERSEEEERALLQLILKTLEDEGLKGEILGEENPLLFSQVGEGEPSLLLYSHVDTTPPYALSVPILKVEDKKAYGLGICDKASLVAMLSAFIEMGKWIGKGSLSLLISSDGEGRGEGLKWFLEGFPRRLQYVIVGEPTNLSIISHHPGVLLLDIYCYGLSAPAGFPLSGTNAIEEMLELIQELKRRLSFTLLAIKGEGYFRIPDICHSIISIPLPVGQDSATILHIIDELLKKQRWMDAAYHIIRAENPLSANSYSRLAEIARRSAISVLGKERDPAPPPWSQAHLFQERGADVIVFGAGHPVVAHSSEEYIVFEDLQIEKEILERIIQALFS